MPDCTVGLLSRSTLPSSCAVDNTHSSSIIMGFSFQEHKAESPAAPFLLAGCACRTWGKEIKKFLLSPQEAGRAYRGGRQINGIHFPRCFAEKVCILTPSSQPCGMAHHGGNKLLSG